MRFDNYEIIFNFVSLCENVYIMVMPSEPKEGNRFLRAVVTCLYEPFDLGSGNQTSLPFVREASVS